MSTLSSFSHHRSDFPALQRTFNGHPLTYFDGPAGTQVPQQVIDAIVAYYSSSNANTHGQFVTTRETDRLLEETRETVAAFLGTSDGSTISFGANMTTLAFSLSKAFARTLKPGDEVLITQLDHEANRSPWLSLRDHGLVVREISITKDASLDYDDLRRKVNERTRLVAMGWASNAFGTINDVALARELTYRVGAWLLVDAVHYAPHFSMSVNTLGIDFLLCSAYKFYGPHVGILYSRKGLLDQLPTDRLRTQDPRSPHRIETGTLNHAAIAGVKAAIEYIASIGTGNMMRDKLVQAMHTMAAYEHGLGKALYEQLAGTEGVTVHGQSFETFERAPTVAFTVRGRTATQVSAALGERGICTWDGHFYAIRPMEVLGLLEEGGVTRVGVSLYNTKEDVDRLIQEVRNMV